MDAMIVSMQVGRGDDWSNRGLPEVVAGLPRFEGATQAGVEWLFEHSPNVSLDNWRLLVWTQIRDQPWHHDKPDAIITPDQYRTAVADRGFSRNQARIRRRALRPEPITNKLRVTEMGLGDAILITQDRRNTTAWSAGGPWFPAQAISEEVVASRIRGITRTTRRGEQSITLKTLAGDLTNLDLRQSVIPVYED